jgi:hypothetical protein
MKIRTWLASSLIAAILAVGPAWAADAQSGCPKKDDSSKKEDKDKSCDKQKECDKAKAGCPKDKEKDAGGCPKK